jgi:hypothetical protein
LITWIFPAGRRFQSKSSVATAELLGQAQVTARHLIAAESFFSLVYRRAKALGIFLEALPFSDDNNVNNYRSISGDRGKDISGRSGLVGWFFLFMSSIL